MRYSHTLIKVLYGPSFAWTRVITAGSIVALLAALGKPPSKNNLDPFLLFIIPAWMLYIIKNLYYPLRKPRLTTVAFISSISYNQRIAVSKLYLKRKAVEVFFFIVPIYLFFLPIRLISVHYSLNNDTFFICITIFIEYLFMVLMLWSVATFSIVKPVKRDTSLYSCITLLLPSGKAFRHTVNRTLWFLSQSGGWFFNRNIRALIRRQWLYLFRFEWFTVFSSTIVCYVSAVYLCFTVPTEHSTTAALILLISPIIIFLFSMRTFSESALKLVQCPYYGVTKRNFYIANTVVSGMLVFPFSVLFVIRVWYITPFTLNLVIPGLISFASLISANAYRSLFSHFTLRGIFFYGVTVICIVLSLLLSATNTLYSVFCASIPFCILILTTLTILIRNEYAKKKIL